MKINTLVKYNFEHLEHKHISVLPFDKKDVFVYMGDIVQMPGHCVVARVSDGKVFVAYHTDSFIELTEDEV